MQVGAEWNYADVLIFYVNLISQLQPDLHIFPIDIDILFAYSSLCFKKNKITSAHVLNVSSFIDNLKFLNETNQIETLFYSSVVMSY